MAKINAADRFVVGAPTVVETGIVLSERTVRHSAGLNFGDCLSYATALVAGEPLRANGDDFTQTDIPLA